MKYSQCGNHANHTLKGVSKRVFKQQRNRAIRRNNKLETPITNRYKGWVD